MAVKFKGGQEYFQIDDNLYIVIESKYHDNIATITFENDDGDKLNIPDGIQIDILNFNGIKDCSILIGFKIPKSGKVIFNLSNTEFTLDMSKNYRILYHDKEILKLNSITEWNIDNYTGY